MSPNSAQSSDDSTGAVGGTGCVHSRPEAFDSLRLHLGEIDHPRTLVRCAIAISRHEIPDLDPAQIEEQLQQIANRIFERSGACSEKALLSFAHQVIFDEWGFRGNETSYYDASNSYISRVLETRRGLPIMLCVIYKDVLERIGIPAVGVNAPGHFMVAVEMDGREVVIDPFHGGRPLSVDEAVQRSNIMTGVDRPIEPEILSHATPEQWIVRMLSNLEHIFYLTQDRQKLAAMLELRALLGKTS